MLILMKAYPGGNIGNYLFHVCHGLQLAQLRQAVLVLPKPLAFRSMNDGAVTFDFSSTNADYDRQILQLGSFIHGNEETRELGFRADYRCMQDHVRPLFRDDCDRTEVDRDTLVIHVRSGDIFAEGGRTPSYAQPPLSWYRKLIEEFSYEKILIVTEDTFPCGGGPNPVIAELQSLYPFLRIQSADLEHDFHTLRCASHLALSRGTFSLAAAMLGTRLKRLHVAHYPTEPAVNLMDLFRPASGFDFEVCHYEVKRYDQVYTWKNTPDQVRALLDHPMDEISLTRHPGTRDEADEREPRVWMQPCEAALAESCVERSHTYLEWGSGGSTLALGGRARRAFSIEHDRRWHAALRGRVEACGVQYLCRPVERGERGWGGGFDEGSYEQFRAYVDAVDELGVERFDRVLIDGRARASCAIKILPYLGAESLVLVHDFWMRPHYYFLLDYYDEVAGIYTYQSLAVLKRKPDLALPYPAPDEVGIPMPPEAWYRGEQPIELLDIARYGDQRLRFGRQR